MPILLATLRSHLMAFQQSKLKADRIRAAHLFGSLLSSDFLAETMQAIHVEEDACLDEDTTLKLFFPQQPSKVLTMEQPLYGTKAFSYNISRLEDQETILEDVREDRARSLRNLQEDVHKAPELLTIAVSFWQKQMASLKEKRKQKNQKKVNLRKKPRNH